jgi:hypothetical protein
LRRKTKKQEEKKKQAEKAKEARQMLELKEKEIELRKTYNVPKTPKQKKSRTNYTSSKRTRPSVGGSRLVFYPLYLLFENNFQEYQG